MDIEITKDEATKDLNVALSEEEFLSKTSIPKEIAVLVFAAYRKGVGEYQTDCWNEKRRRQEAEKKFTRLAVKMAEEAIKEEITVTMKF